MASDTLDQQLADLDAYLFPERQQQPAAQPPTAGPDPAQIAGPMPTGGPGPRPPSPAPAGNDQAAMAQLDQFLFPEKQQGYQPGDFQQAVDQGMRGARRESDAQDQQVKALSAYQSLSPDQQQDRQQGFIAQAVKAQPWDRDKEGLYSWERKFKESYASAFPDADPAQAHQAFQRAITVDDYFKRAKRFSQDEASARVAGLEHIPQQDRPLFLEILHDVAPSAVPDRTYLQRWMGAPGEGINQVGENLSSFWANLRAGGVDPLGNRKQERETVDFSREAQETRRGVESEKFDKSFGDTPWLLRKAAQAPVDLTRSAPSLAVGTALSATMGPEAGAAFWYTQTQPELRDTLKKTGFSDKLADQGSMIAAAPMSMIMQLQAANIISPAVANSAKQAALTEAKGLMKEWGSHAAAAWSDQVFLEATKLATKRVLQGIEKDVKIDWQKETGQSLESIATAAVHMPLMTLPGAALRARGAEARAPGAPQPEGSIRGEVLPDKGHTGADFLQGTREYSDPHAQLSPEMQQRLGVQQSAGTERPAAPPRDLGSYQARRTMLDLGEPDRAKAKEQEGAGNPAVRARLAANEMLAPRKEGPLDAGERQVADALQLTARALDSGSKLTEGQRAHVHETLRTADVNPYYRERLQDAFKALDPAKFDQEMQAPAGRQPAPKTMGNIDLPEAKGRRLTAETQDAGALPGQDSQRLTGEAQDAGRYPGSMLGRAAGEATDTTATPARRPAEAAEPRAVSYETSKGSKYTVHEDGTTTRNKADHSAVGHDAGDVGVKDRSHKTVYVDPKVASALSSAGQVGVKRSRVILKDGKASLLTWNDQENRWGRAPSGTDVPVHDKPAVGLAPLELWKNRNDIPGYSEAYSGMHAGNAITKVEHSTPASRPEPRPSFGRGGEASPTQLAPRQPASMLAREAGAAAKDRAGTFDLAEPQQGGQPVPRRYSDQDLARAEKIVQDAGAVEPRHLERWGYSRKVSAEMLQELKDLGRLKTETDSTGIVTRYAPAERGQATRPEPGLPMRTVEPLTDQRRPSPRRLGAEVAIDEGQDLLALKREVQRSGQSAAPIWREVTKLGSEQAVAEAFKGGNPASRYARALAERMYGTKEQAQEGPQQARQGVPAAEGAHEAPVRPSSGPEASQEVSRPATPGKDLAALERAAAKSGANVVTTRKKVVSLGSEQAVAEFFDGKSPHDKYARAYAADYYSKDKPSYEQPAEAKPAGRQRFAGQDELIAQAKEQELRQEGFTEKQLQIMRDKGTFNREVDATTGFQEGRTGTARVDAVHRAQEHVAKSGENAVYVAQDLRNLGGLNAKLTETGANKVYRDLAHIAADELKGIEGADAQFFRHGGDELSAVVVNADRGKVEAALQRAEARMKDYVRENGLEDLEHPKYKGDASHYGTGLSYGVQEIKPGQPVKEIFGKAEKQLEDNKKQGKANVNRSEAAASGSEPSGGQAGRVAGGTGAANQGGRGGHQEAARGDAGTPAAAPGAKPPGGQAGGTASGVGTALSERRARGQETARNDAGTTAATTAAGQAAGTSSDLGGGRVPDGRGNGPGSGTDRGRAGPQERSEARPATERPPQTQLTEAQQERLERELLAKKGRTSYDLANRLDVPSNLIRDALKVLHKDGRLTEVGADREGNPIFKIKKAEAEKAFQGMTPDQRAELEAIRAEKQARGEVSKRRNLAEPESRKRSEPDVTLPDEEILARHKAALRKQGLSEKHVATLEPPTAPGATAGQKTEIEAHGFDKPIPARYAVVELDTLAPSHDFTSGSPRSNVEAGRYPKDLQPRDYSKGSDEAAKVQRFADERKAGFYLSTHPGADSGPPVVSPSGVVINGNGRAMSLQLAAGMENYSWYKGKLVEQSHLFGVDPAKVKGMSRPVLVRVVEMDPGSAEAQKFARAGNVSTTQSQSPVRTAASLSKLISHDLLDSLNLRDETTFSEAVTDPSAGKAFRRRLYENLPAAERTRFFHPDQRLTDAGKELTQGLLLSKVVPVETIERLGEERKGLKRTLEGAIPQLLKTARDYPAADLTKPLNEALAFIARNPELRSLGRVDDYLDQGNLFSASGKHETLSPAGRMLVDFIVQDGDRPLVFRRKLGDLLGGLSQSKGLFGGEMPDVATLAADALGVEQRKGAAFGQAGEAKAGTRRPPLQTEEMPKALQRIDKYLDRAQTTKEKLQALADVDTEIIDHVYALPEARNLGIHTNEFMRRVEGGWLEWLDSPKDKYAQEQLRRVLDMHRDRIENTLIPALRQLAEDGKTVRDVMARSVDLGKVADYYEQRAIPAIDAVAKEAGVTLSAAEEAARKADLRDQQGDIHGAGFGPQLGRPIKRRGDVIGGVPEEMRAQNAEVEERLAGARGIEKPGLWSRIKEIAVAAWHGLTRAQFHLPNSAEYAHANEFFRLLKNVPDKASDEVNRTVAAIVDPLGEKQLKLFERKLLVDNQLAALERGEPLRFGFKDRAEVEAYRQQLDNLIAKTPEVKEALATRKKVIGEKVQELVDHGILDKSALDNPDYFHQQVTAKLQAERLASGGSKPFRLERGFQKARTKGEGQLGVEHDYNTSYIEAEASWLHEAQVELEKEKMLRKLGDRYDILPELQAEAKRTGKSVETLLKERPDHAVWTPGPGNAFHKSLGVSEQVVEHLQQGILDGEELSPADRQAVNTLVGRGRLFVLPKDLVKQLHETTKGEPPGTVAKVANELMGAWKAWVLFNPKRALPYMLRNVTGDIDPVLGGAVGAVKYVPQAMRELASFYRGDLSMSPELRAARDHAVIGSSLTAQEIPDLKDLQVFKRFYQSDGTKLGAFAQLPATYFEKVKAFNEFRENSLRYAAFLHYRDALENGNLSHYGGAKRAVVDALAKDLGHDVAAAHLSRNLLGDYGNTSVGSKWMSKYLYPFWSWEAVNFNRTVNMATNAIKSGGIVSPGAVLPAAAYSAFTLARMGSLYGAVYLFNNLVHPQQEAKLTDEERASPHLTLGQNADGSVRIFRKVGALGDMGEWADLPKLAALYPQVQAGQATWGDMLEALAKAPVNKLLGGARPDAKAVVEATSGQSFYPDAFKPRPQDRSEALTGVLGAQDETKFLRGTLGGTGETVRPGYGDRFLGISSSNPEKTALSEMTDLRNKFLRQEGHKTPEGFSGATAFHRLRDAAIAGDLDAFKAAKKAYEAEGGKYESFIRSLRNLDPIASRLKGDADIEGDTKRIAADDNLERKFVEKFLTPEQRQRLTVAREYARRLEVDMYSLWRRAAEGGSPEERTAYSASVDKELVSIGRKLAANRPLKLDDREGWEKDIDHSLDYLRRHQIDPWQVREAYWDHLRRDVHSADARTANFGRFLRNLRDLEDAPAKPAGAK